MYPARESHDTQFKMRLSEVMPSATSTRKGRHAIPHGNARKNGCAILHRSCISQIMKLSIGIRAVDGRARIGDCALTEPAVNRPPSRHWHQFDLQALEVHAKATLDSGWLCRDRSDSHGSFSFPESHRVHIDWRQQGRSTACNSQAAVDRDWRSIRCGGPHHLDRGRVRVDDRTVPL
jgi:hypothetical protein